MEGWSGRARGATPRGSVRVGFCCGRDREKEELEAGCPLGSSRRACSEVLAEAGCHLHSSEVFFKRLGHTLQKPKQPPSPHKQKKPWVTLRGFCPEGGSPGYGRKRERLWARSKGEKIKRVRREGADEVALG